MHSKPFHLTIIFLVTLFLIQARAATTETPGFLINGVKPTLSADEVLNHWGEPEFESPGNMDWEAHCRISYNEQKRVYLVTGTSLTFPGGTIELGDSEASAFEKLPRMPHSMDESPDLFALRNVDKTGNGLYLQTKTNENGVRIVTEIILISPSDITPRDTRPMKIRLFEWKLWKKIRKRSAVPQHS